MYDHIGLKVKDMKASVRFYAAVLAPLGHVAGSSGEGYAGFGPKDAAAFLIDLDGNNIEAVCFK